MHIHVRLFNTLDYCTRLIPKGVPKREVASSHFLHFWILLPSSYERHQSVVDLWHWRRWQDDKLILMYFYRDTHPFSSSLPDLCSKEETSMLKTFLYTNDGKMMKWGDFYLIIISRDVGCEVCTLTSYKYRNLMGFFLCRVVWIGREDFSPC